MKGSGPFMYEKWKQIVEKTIPILELLYRET